MREELQDKDQQVRSVFKLFTETISKKFPHFKDKKLYILLH